MVSLNALRDPDAEIIVTSRVDDQTASGVETASHNLDALTEKAEATEAALSGVGAATKAAGKGIAEGADQISVGLTQSVMKAKIELDTLRKTLSGLKAEQKALNSALDVAPSIGVDTGEMTTRLGEVQSEIEKVSGAVEKARTKLDAAKISMDAYDGSLGEGSVMARMLRDQVLNATDAAIDMGKGIKAGPDSSLTNFLRTARSVGDEVSRLSLRLETAQDRLSQLQATAPTLVSKGSLSQGDADATIAAAKANVASLENEISVARQARAAVDDLTAAHASNAAETKKVKIQYDQLILQGHQFLDMVVAGGNPLKAAFYELPTMAYAMGGFGNAMKTVTGLMTGPAGLGVAAAAGGAALTGMAMHAESSASKLLKLAQQMRATRADAQTMAADIAIASRQIKLELPDLSIDQSSHVASVIGSAYNFSGGTNDIAALAHIAQDAGTVFGSLENGLKAVTTAMADPVAEIEELYKTHLPGVKKELVDQVQHLQAAGDYGKAYALTIGAIEAATKDAHDNALTPFQKQMADLKSFTDPTIESLEKLSEGIGTKLLSKINDLLGLVDQTAHWAFGTSTASSSNGLTGNTVLDNYSGGNHHYGLGQVDPRYSYGYDIMTPEGNIAASMTNFMEQLKRADGKWDNTLALYSGNKIGSAGARNYASAVYGYDISKLPSDTSALIDATAVLRGLPERVLNLYKQIVGHESGGHQYSNWSSAQKADAGHATSAAVIDNTASLKYAAPAISGSSISEQRHALADSMSALQKYMGTLQTGSAEWNKYNEALGHTRAEFVALRDPVEQFAYDQDKAAKASAGLTAYQRDMISIAQQVDQAQMSLNGTHASSAQILRAQAVEQGRLASEWENSLAAAGRAADGQEAINAAYAQSSSALDHVTNYQKAYEQALADFGPGAADLTKHVEDMTAKLDASTLAMKNQNLIAQTWSNRDQVSVLQAETASIGMNEDARARMISRMQEEQDLTRQGIPLTSKEAQAYLESSDAALEASQAYQHASQTMETLTGSIENMTSQLSDGVVQGFLQGTSSGMSFKSTLQGIETQIGSLVVKLGLINPLLNEIDGGTRSTLGEITNLLSGNSHSSASGGSSGGYDWGDTGSMTNFSGPGTSLSPGEFLNFKNSAANSGAQSSFLGSIMNTKTIGGTSIGGMLAGIGSGMATGSLVTSAMGGGKYGEIGSGAGSVVGTLGGSFFGPLGAQIGGTVLGAIGGLIGSLFQKSHYAYDDFSGVNGSLAITASRVKRSDDDVTGSLQDALDQLNAEYGYAGITVADGYTGSVGHYKKGKKTNDRDLSANLGDIPLVSSDPNMQMALDQLMPKTFDSADTYVQSIQSLDELVKGLDSMNAVVGKFTDSSHLVVDHFTGYTGDMAKAVETLDGKTMSVSDLESKFQAIQTFVGDTMPSLLNVTSAGSESLMQQVADLQQKYQDAADTAASYGLDAQKLLDTGSAIAAQMIASQKATLSWNDQSVQARYLSASGNQEGADLLNFDVSAGQQEQQLRDSWQGFLGDTYASSADFQSQMLDLEKTLGAERLKIQKQYDDQAVEDAAEAAQARASAWSSITDMQTSWRASDMSANGDDAGAALLNFDASATQQRAQFQTLADAYWGDQYASQAQYQQMVIDLDKSLADQRIQIQNQYQQQALQDQKQYEDQANSSVASVFSSLTDYASNLLLSDASPLSVQDQYKLANDNLQSDYALALGGDYDALGRIQSDMQSWLTDSKAWNGSGTGYSDDMSQGLKMLQSLSNLGSDKYTASLAKTLSKQSTDATLAVKQAVENMQKAVTEELRQFSRNVIVKGRTA